MGPTDDSEIKDWLREIRIEKIERILKAIKNKKRRPKNS